MPTMTLPIGGGFYSSESLPLSHQRCVNWIPVIPQTANASSNVVLFNAHGQKEFLTLGGVNRGQHEMAEFGYTVSGNTLYKIKSDKTSENLGAIEGIGMVSMADNGLKLVIVVPGGKSYVYDGAALAEITDTDFITSDTVSFKDGYFIFTASSGKVFFNSALNDPTNFRALDFGTAEINPDKIVASYVVHNELFILGTETIELFQNVGGSDFPFQRIQGANIQKGSHAKFGIVGLDETFAFVGGGEGERTAIYQVADSSRAIKISTAAIDNAIQKFSKEEISNCIAFSYFDRGMQIAAFTFESEGIDSRTFAFNSTTSKLSGVPTWFELQSGVNNNRWNLNSVLKIYGKLLGGTDNGKIVELDHETYTDSGSVIRREFTSGAFSNEEKPLFLPQIILWMDAGVGTSGQGLDPVITLEYSDNGRTFGNGRTRKIGKTGEYNKQIIWRRNGRTPFFRVHRFIITDPVKAVIRKLQAVAVASAERG